MKNLYGVLKEVVPMVVIAIVVVALIESCAPAFAEGPDRSVGEKLQDVSVNITCPSSGYNSGGTQGSGTIIQVPVEGKPATWILTAHHVVDGLKVVKTVIAPDGSTRKKVSFRDAQIIQERVYNGRAVGEEKYDAKIVNVDSSRDIALLRVRIGQFTEAKASFYLDATIPAPGTRLYHCGAPGGKELGGTCSLTSGIVSRLGVRIPEFGGSEHGIFDQVTCPAMGGSSGGLVARENDGRVVGMITLGLRSGNSFHWMVPVRSLRDWATEAGVEWLFDPDASPPTEEQISELPLELDGDGFPEGDDSGGQSATQDGPHVRTTDLK